MEERIIETNTCTHCQAPFIITERDLQYYQKISPTFAGKKYLIPAPTFCPDCRQQRRLIQRNERNLYRRTCGMTWETMVSIYSPDKQQLVYDQKNRRTDKRNPLDYGQDIDFTKSFFDQFNALSIRVPRPSLINMSSENSEYTNHSAYNKDCYMCLNTGYTENSMYCSNYCIYDKNCVDCLNIHHTENSYFCTDVKKTNDCRYLFNCINCFKCYFCEDCSWCNNCFLCTNLRNKNFCIENKQYTKEEYTTIVDHYLHKIAEGNTDEILQMFERIRHKSIYRNVIIEQSENCSGDRVYACKDTKDSYYVFDMHDCAYCYDAGDLKDSYDAYEPFRGEAQYETHACNLWYHLTCCSKCYESTSLLYCQYCRYCKDCFGCFGLRDHQYCIFNKQYSKPEYETLVGQLIDHMQTTNERGEFFPTSPFGYNETVANEYYPLTESEALKQWFTRSHYETPFPQVERILQAGELPAIAEVTDEILQHAIICEVSGKPFRIIRQELDFYRSHHLPLPRKHPDIRHAERMRQRNLRKLRDRNCAKCWISMKTTYAPERPEVVYCEACYNKEIYG